VYVTCAIIAVLLLLRAMPSPAQDVTEHALKGGYIYNFAKFTEWPADALPADATVVMCVLGDAAVGDALARTVKGREIAGRGMKVLQVVETGPLRTCHTLYVSGLSSEQAQKLVAGLHDAPVLTIGDIDGFTEIGGMARFFLDRNKIRFSVNLEPVKRARLHISSLLLVLAKRP